MTSKAQEIQKRQAVFEGVLSKLRWCANGTSWVYLTPDEARVLVDELGEDRTTKPGTTDVRETNYEFYRGEDDEQLGYPA